eukprot:2797-Heterococcus_DN1.PRE.2
MICRLLVLLCCAAACCAQQTFFSEAAPQTILQEGDDSTDEHSDSRQLQARALPNAQDLCFSNATMCFTNPSCRQCIMLGATSVDARLTRNCADAKGAFFNSYNGSSSTDKNLKCEPYNDASALGGYLECIWEAG